MSRLFRRCVRIPDSSTESTRSWHDLQLARLDHRRVQLAGSGIWRHRNVYDDGCLLSPHGTAIADDARRRRRRTTPISIIIDASGDVSSIARKHAARNVPEPVDGRLSVPTGPRLTSMVAECKSDARTAMRPRPGRLLLPECRSVEDSLIDRNAEAAGLQQLRSMTTGTLHGWLKPVRLCFMTVRHCANHLSAESSAASSDSHVLRSTPGLSICRRLAVGVGGSAFHLRIAGAHRLWRQSFALLDHRIRCCNFLPHGLPAGLPSHHRRLDHKQLSLVGLFMPTLPARFCCRELAIQPLRRQYSALIPETQWCPHLYCLMQCFG